MIHGCTPPWGWDGRPARRPFKRARLEGMKHKATVETMCASIGEGSSNIGRHQQLAMSMIRDGVENKAINAFASLGTFGKHECHIERDFHAWTRHLYGLKVDPYKLWVEVFRKGIELIMCICFFFSFMFIFV